MSVHPMQWAQAAKDANGMPLFNLSQLAQLSRTDDPLRYIYNVGYADGMYDSQPVPLHSANAEDGPSLWDEPIAPEHA